MKKVYLFAVMSAMLAACSTQTDELSTVVDQPSVNDPAAINFDVYTNRATTRAGLPGAIDDASLQSGAHKTAGFGIFAYYTDNGTYDQYYKPNFMYNQQVTYTAAKWTYEPVKYWPNEFGNAAQSDDVDHVSFFAYAPWVKVVPNTGAVDVTGLTPAAAAQAQNYNITAMTHNASTGDPLIKYVVDWNPATSVDLLWGVDATTGLPFMNQVKQGVDGKMTFNLKHALSMLNIQIDAIMDATTAPSTDEVNAKTKIWVRSITFEGFATKGALNLNNTSANLPLWMDYAGSNELSTDPFTIYDGRKDGKEGYALNDGTATNEKVLGLNPVLVQPGPYDITTAPTTLGAAQPGVLKTAVNLFESATPAQPIFVIPTNEQLKVTIVYDVETWDDNLSGYLADGVVHGSTIENKITKPIGLTMLPGNAYIINLHLGMTTVKVDAKVTAWPASIDTDVDLPSNAIAAVSNAASAAYTAGTTITTSGSSTGSTVTFNAPVANIATDLPAFFANLAAQGVGTITYGGTGYTWDGASYKNGTTELVGAGGTIDPTVTPYNAPTSPGSPIDWTFNIGTTLITVSITLT